MLSGPYIAADPGDGPRQQHFIGLEKPPILKKEVEGEYYSLDTDHLGSLTTGTPIQFHGIAVGEVLNHQLSANGERIRVTIFIDAPYHRFVRNTSRFWKESGLDFSASAEGFEFRTHSLVSLLSGSIAFNTPNRLGESVHADPNTVFHLYENYDESRQQVYTDGLKYVMFFEGDVHGLTIGAPVQLMGIPVGRVVSINLELDENSKDIRIPVVVELQSQRIKRVNGDNDLEDEEIIAWFINKGLRAQLKTGSLLTGRLLIDLNFHPDTPINLTEYASHYVELPTIPGTLDQFADSAKDVLTKLSQLPLDDLVSQINTTLTAMEKTSSTATKVLNSAETTLVSASRTIESADKTLTTFGPDSDTRYQLDRMLRETSQAAKSIRELADYLEQNPGALIGGK